jgi:hypothetical protein
MKSLKRAFNINDTLYTPPCLVKPLCVPLCEWSAKEDIKILCPFDNEYSEYVKQFSAWGYTVEFGDIADGQDFFKRKRPDVDIIISNPPFSKKLAVFEKLFEWGIPFAMLMNMMAINYQEIGELFQKQNPQPQFIIPDKKVSFNGKTSSFCSGYVTWKMIERTQFVHLENNNTGNNFVPGENYHDVR